MRHAVLLVVLMLGALAAGCVSAPGVLTNPPSPELKDEVRPDATLFSTDTDALSAAFRRFACSPGTIPDLRFANLNAASGEIRFTFVPAGWKLWRKNEQDIQEIQCDGDDIWSYIGIRPVPDLDLTSTSLQGVGCEKGKGNTDYVENRYILTRCGWTEVRFTVIAHRGTLADMLGYLQKHYGEYEGVCHQVKQLAHDEKPLRPAALFQGSHSQIAKESFRVIKTPGEWKSLWEEHRGEFDRRAFTEYEQSFDVDFEENLVVALFTGRCDWCEVTPRLRGDAVVIGYQADMYQRISFASQNIPPTPVEKAKEAREVAKAPYALIVLRKPVKTIVIEQDVRRVIDAPPVWKHRQTFKLAE